MNIDDINEIIKNYSYILSNDNKYTSFKSYLKNNLDNNKDVSIIILDYVKNQDYNNKVKIINRYINKLLEDSNDIINKVYLIYNYINSVSNEEEKEKIILNIINNFNLKTLLFSMVNGNTINLTNKKKNYSKTDFYLIFDLFCDKNNIELIYDEVDYAEFDDNVKLYLKDIGGVKRLTKDEEKELLLLIFNGDKDAKDKFISANLRLVIPVAARYYSAYSNFDFLDLIQEGNIAMIKALDNYDLRMNAKFSTYATACINNSLKRYVSNNNKNIRYPANIISDIKKLNKVYIELEMRLFRKPTHEELASELKFSLDYVNKLLTLKDREISLNNKVSLEHDEYDYEIIDIIKDTSENVEENALDHICLEDILRIIDESDISEKNLKILFDSCDLGFNNKQKITDLAKKYNVSYAAIMQIIKRVKKRLRKNDQLRQYYYVDDIENYDYKLEFFNEANMNKFNLSEMVCFKDGSSMTSWFFKNKNKLESSSDKIDKKIMNQYKLYVEKLKKENEIDEEQILLNQKLEFLSIDNIDKYVSSSNITFRDGTNTGAWFLNHKIEMDFSTKEIDKVIIREYKKVLDKKRKKRYI